MNTVTGSSYSPAYNDLVEDFRNFQEVRILKPNLEDSLFSLDYIDCRDIILGVGDNTSINIRALNTTTRSQSRSQGQDSRRTDWTLDRV